jgi:hypothetical protein
MTLAGRKSSGISANEMECFWETAITYRVIGDCREAVKAAEEHVRVING